MAFDSFDAFIAMGGHGPYVWACYAVFFALTFVLVFWSKRQRLAALRQVTNRLEAAPDKTGKPAAASFARVDSSKD